MENFGIRKLWLVRFLDAVFGRLGENIKHYGIQTWDAACDGSGIVLVHSIETFSGERFTGLRVHLNMTDDSLRYGEIYGLPLADRADVLFWERGKFLTLDEMNQAAPNTWWRRLLGSVIPILALLTLLAAVKYFAVRPTSTTAVLGEEDVDVMEIHRSGRYSRESWYLPAAVCQELAPENCTPFDGNMDWVRFWVADK